MTEQLGLSLFKYAFWIYLVSAACYLVALVGSQTRLARVGRVLLVAGLAVHTASITIIAIVIGRLPLLNLYEYMLSFTWAAVVVYLAVELFTRNSSLGGFSVPLISAFALFTMRLPNAKIDYSVMPALQSAWRTPHIVSGILAYGASMVAFVLAVMYLLRENADRRAQADPKSQSRSFWASRLPVAKVLDRTIYRTVAFGFLMQTLLVVIGAVWAQIAWGRYWGWDPKETWSLITWLIYATYLHTHTMMGWRGRRSAWLAIIGFGATIFTFLGVTYFFHGLHSYATG
ncbi:MAG: c-type cytochrome biogenesis protein CcsB [Armatimonadetes bacterium]|jgi:cytochrome c-type biogenesis protein CcsB|nr:c-type cytochrome biogenesis protein CcsB [Armatimonadota bacterium]